MNRSKTKSKLARFFTASLLALLALYTSSMLADVPQDSSDLFARANQLLQESNSSEKNARELILAANKTRKTIAELRAKSRKEKDVNKKNSMIENANTQAETLAKQQEQGAKARVDALNLRAESHRIMQQAFVERWQKWVTTQTPLTMDKETINFIAHNTQIRSVHPTMLNKMGSVQENSQQDGQAQPNNSMTLQIPALISQNAPPDLNIDAFRLSNNQHYFAHIEVNGASSQKLTNVSQVPLNQMHHWRLLVSDKLGEPITNAKIEIVGHMPGHVHGLPTQPQVTRALGDGVYLVEGLKFQMQGWWVIQFNIIGSEKPESENSSSLVPDSIIFNLIL